MYLKLLFSIVLLQFVIQDAVLGQNACRAISGQIGRCIELKTCSSLYQILRKNPLTPDDRQKLAQSQCGWQNNQPLVRLIKISSCKKRN
uniref:CSON015050 protein n=1 Tax=Culicoides sonorensis TaxID=179676 RepID=A0A336LP12_CULSO